MFSGGFCLLLIVKENFVVNQYLPDVPPDVIGESRTPGKNKKAHMNPAGIASMLPSKTHVREPSVNCHYFTFLVAVRCCVRSPVAHAASHTVFFLIHHYKILTNLLSNTTAWYCVDLNVVLH